MRTTDSPSGSRAARIGRWALSAWLLCAAGRDGFASAPDATEAGAAYDEIERLTEVMLLIRKHYVDEKTYKQIIDGALHGMLDALDPYSAFLEPEAYSEMQDETSGRYGGIGLQLGMREGLLTVIAPIEDTPAYRAGVQPGEKIVAIDGEKTAGISLRDAVKKLRGQKGTKVTLSLRSPNDAKTRDVEIVRDDIESPSVKGGRILRDGVGYIRITLFAAPTPETFQKELDRLTQAGMDALVLDLRGNPGGLLKSAVAIGGMFLKKSQPVVTTRSREGTAEPESPAETNVTRFKDAPVAVLVNVGSASASEIVAGALQDHKRAVIVGDRTYGKASVQSVMRLKSDDKAAVRLTTAHYFTPSGREIDGKGVEPDIHVSVSPDEWRRIQIRRAHIENPDLYSDQEKREFADVVDRQLDRAVDVLQAVKIFKAAKRK